MGTAVVKVERAPIGLWVLLGGLAVVVIIPMIYLGFTGFMNPVDWRSTSSTESSADFQNAKLAVDPAWKFVSGSHDAKALGTTIQATYEVPKGLTLDDAMAKLSQEWAAKPRIVLESETLKFRTSGSFLELKRVGNHTIEIFFTNG